MQKRIFRRQRDPHSVYPRIRCALGELSEWEFARRCLITVSSDFYAVRLLLAAAGDVGALLRLPMSRAPVFVCEFSGLVYLALWPLLWFAGRRRRVVLNVNHNLNNKLESAFALPLLARMTGIQVAFIEPSPHLSAEFPYITPIRLVGPADPEVVAIRSVYCFVGTRDEQVRPDAGRYINELRSYCADAVVVGKGGVRLGEDDYAQAFSGRSAIVALYRSEAYGHRHSGVVLEALARGSLVLLPTGDLGEHYAHRGFRVVCFDGPGDLRASLGRARGTCSVEGAANE